MGEAVVITGSNSGSEGLQVARSIGQEKETVGEKGERNSIMDVNKKNESGGGGGGVCNNMKSGNTNGAVKWDRLFPKMALRVLLVEADDSTRHIIAALLKKCCYRVAAVPDGLKAWEMLKGRPHNIDLILTEVDLPAISGYALLTLIMEHDICKNIPVIMMSSHNSISTVYKCMMRGACDYLVKPIRKNELRNLWQHVWRKRSSLAGGISPQDESVGQDKAEATSENNAASNNSAGAQKSKECAEKESDAQSSCTKPEVEAESSPVEYVQDSELPASGNLSTNAKMHSQEMHTYFGHKFPFDERETRALADPKESITVAVVNIVEQQGHRIDANIHGEASENYPVHVSREAIDFMGASTKHISSPNNTQTKFDFSPHLDLTLRRSNPIGFEIQGSEERRTLRHSDASAFTRYTNRSPHTPHSTSASICDEKELGDKLERRLCCNMGSHLSDKLSTSPRGQRSVISLVNAPKESELAKSCARERIFPIQIPVEGVNYNTMGTNYASTFPAVFSRHAVVSPTPSPSSASQPESLLRANSFHQSNFNSNSEHFYEWRVQNAHDSTNQGMQKHERRLDTAEDQGQISPATDQSANSSFCNGVASHLNSIGYGSASGSSASGSNSNIDRVAMAMAAAENKNGEVTFAQNVSSHRSIQREAALNKFRMKRKERCYEKKVRYESRKKLAEQRPRVKGQFVRHVQADPLYSEPK